MGFYYFNKIFRLFAHSYKIIQKLQRIIKPIHPLERVFIFLNTIYITASILLIPKTLGEQINGYMCVSNWLFFLIVPGLIIGYVITIYAQSLPHYVIFTIFNIIPIFLYGSLILFIKELCETIFCTNNDYLVKISIALLSSSILYELAILSLGYAIWKKGIWKYRNEYDKIGYEKCHA